MKKELRDFNGEIATVTGFTFFFTRSSLTFQGGVDYSAFKIQKNQEYGGNYSGSALITVGYKFWINDNNPYLRRHMHPTF